jgi:radical SAM superfamily enzyme YgiQ (UPF0313 family)
MGMPWPCLERVGIYANARDILRKNVEELKALKDLGLGILYLGVESGSQEILRHIQAHNLERSRYVGELKAIKQLYQDFFGEDRNYPYCYR